MATVSPEQGGSQEPAPATGAGPEIRAGLLALFAVVSMLALAISIVAVVIAGAHDESPAGAGGPTQTEPVELGDLFVEPERIDVPPGTQLTVDVTNTGDQEHDLTLNGETGTDRLQPGESQTADFGVINEDVQAWCTVPGHKEAGMVLDIVVTDAAPQSPQSPG